MTIDYAALGRAIAAVRKPTQQAPLGYEQDSVCLLLAERAETVLLAIENTTSDGYDWSGQVALPGGRIEPADPTPRDAALRELHEELGIPPGNVAVLGELGHFQTGTSNHDLDVFVGRWARPAEIHADPREVARVLELPLADLIKLHRAQGYRGQPATAFGDDLAYPVADARIWGVTARILHHFLELVLDHGVAA